MHKITLCQAEGMMKRNRHGKEMNEEELEQNRYCCTLRIYCTTRLYCRTVLFCWTLRLYYCTVPYCTAVLLQDNPTAEPEDPGGTVTARRRGKKTRQTKPHSGKNIYKDSCWRISSPMEEDKNTQTRDLQSLPLPCSVQSILTPHLLLFTFPPTTVQNMRPC